MSVLWTATHMWGGDVTADRFASTAADILLGCDHATGRKLMRTAVRLLAHRPHSLTSPPQPVSKSI
jgi:hypothetical protein